MLFTMITDAPLVRSAHRHASENITGYNAHGALAATRTRAEQLAALFRDHGPPPPAEFVFVAADQENDRLAGAAILETPYDQKVTETDAELARDLARRHCTLAALFVAEDYRHQGIARHLVWEVAGANLMSQGVRYLEGFVDDRAGSVDFYRRAQATVCGHNEGLPPRAPTQIRGLHSGADNGHWFYFDLWPALAGPHVRCARCTSPLRFDPADGGFFICDTCQPAPKIP